MTNRKKPAIKWKFDGHDWQLRVNGVYFGMVCPGIGACKTSRFIGPSGVFDGERTVDADSVKEAKSLLVSVSQHLGDADAAWLKVIKDGAK